MFITKKRKYFGVISLLIAGCFMITSCGLLSGKSNKAPEEIESVVSDYMDSIADGDFADDYYESDLATDAPFADLEFSDEAVEAMMQSALEKITYEIDASEGNEKDGEGSCDIVLTAVDLDAIIEDLGEELDAETLQSAIDDKKAPTEDYEITLDLEYEEDEEEWLISDTSELSEILGEPFADLELPSASDPAEVASTFLEDLKAGDFDTVSTMTDGYYTEADFIDLNYDVSSKLFEAVFGNMTYEIIDPGTSSDTEISFQVDFSYADYWSSLATISADVQVMSDLIKPIVLAVANYEEGTVEYENYLNNLGEKVVGDLQNSSSIYDDTDSLDLYYDSVKETWFVEYVPYSLCSFYDLENYFDPMATIDQTVYDEIMLDVYNDLLADGSITQAQYDEYFPPVVYDSAIVLAAITDQGWYDYATDGFVTAYTADVTTLEYELFFSQDLSGLVLNCQFYRNNGTVLMGDIFPLTIEPGWTSCYFNYQYDDSAAFEADTYRVVISMTDGTVLVDQSITVG